MKVEKIEIDRERAQKLWRDYQKHAHYSTPMDEEIRRAYHLISRGRMIIQALASITAAGLHDAPFTDNHRKPKLAIARADAKRCDMQTSNGSVSFYADYDKPREQKRRIEVPMPGVRSTDASGRAIIPLIPIGVRPRRGIQNYHILWEAEWQTIPHDPMLLRRIGRADMWIVVAAWDLTQVERAAMASRLSA